MAAVTTTAMTEEFREKCLEAIKAFAYAAEVVSQMDTTFKEVMEEIRQQRQVDELVDRGVAAASRKRKAEEEEQVPEAKKGDVTATTSSVKCATSTCANAPKSVKQRNGEIRVMKMCEDCLAAKRQAKKKKEESEETPVAGSPPVSSLTETGNMVKRGVLAKGEAERYVKKLMSEDKEYGKEVGSGIPLAQWIVSKVKERISKKTAHDADDVAFIPPLPFKDPAQFVGYYSIPKGELCLAEVKDAKRVMGAKDTIVFYTNGVDGDGVSV